MDCMRILARSTENTHSFYVTAREYITLGGYNREGAALAVLVLVLFTIFWFECVRADPRARKL